MASRNRCANSRRNVGFLSERLSPGDAWRGRALARKEAIHIEPRFSDHAPLTIDYDFTL